MERRRPRCQRCGGGNWWHLVNYVTSSQLSMRELQTHLDFCAMQVAAATQIGIDSQEAHLKIILDGLHEWLKITVLVIQLKY